jgi:hypothetical protein
MEILIILQTSIPAKELFTVDSLGTLVGLSGMVLVASNSIQKAFNYNPKWFALVLAEILSIISVHYAIENPQFIDYLLGVFNGFLVYLTSSGGAGIIDANTKDKTDDNESLNAIPKRRRFSERWW